MALDGTSTELFEPLSTGKKGTGVFVQKIQQELGNSSIGDISEYKGFGDISPSFVEWKMKYYNEVELLLALIDRKDKESIFFRTFLSETLLSDIDNFRIRLLEISAKNA